MIIFTHNDLDAIGCLLCFKKVGLPLDKVFTTNYGDLEEKVETISKINDTKLLVADVSFGTRPNLLLKLKTKFPKVVLIDHHMINPDVAKQFQDAGIRTYLGSDCAAKICYKVFKILDSNLKETINKINVYDIWQRHDPRFKEMLIINEWFFSKTESLLELVDLFEDFKFPKEINEFKPNFIKKFREDFQQMKSVIVRKNSKVKITFVFTWQYFNLILTSEFKDGQDIVVGIQNGIMKVRIRDDSIIPNETRNKLRMFLVNSENFGHFNAFTFPIPDKSMKGMQEILNNIINFFEKEF